MRSPMAYYVASSVRCGAQEHLNPRPISRTCGPPGAAGHEGGSNVQPELESGSDHGWTVWALFPLPTDL
jgi:hypothetical protein